MLDIGEPIPPSKIVENMEDGLAFAKKSATPSLSAPLIRLAAPAGDLQPMMKNFGKCSSAALT